MLREREREREGGGV